MSNQSRCVFNVRGGRGRGVNKEVRDKRSRVNILTIKIDLNLRVESYSRIYSFPPSACYSREQQKDGLKLYQDLSISLKLRRHSAEPSLFCFPFRRLLVRAMWHPSALRVPLISSKPEFSQADGHLV